MKKIRLIILFLPFLMLMSCDSFFALLDELTCYVEQVYFQSENYSVMEGNTLICNLIAEPDDSFDYYSADFSVADSDICFIKSTSAKSCTIYAKKSGSTVITAEVNGLECQAVINVN